MDKQEIFVTWHRYYMSIITGIASGIGAWVICIAPEINSGYQVPNVLALLVAMLFAAFTTHYMISSIPVMVARGREEEAKNSLSDVDDVVRRHQW